MGAGILCLLVVIGFGIAYQGRNYDPSRFRPDEAALESTRADIEGKAGTLRADDMRAFESAGPVSAEGGAPASALDAYGAYEDVAFSASGASAIEQLQPYAGFGALGPTENYYPDSLYEKINGRAPAYLNFNFVALAFRSFTVDAVPGAFIDVFVYTMDSPVNAFGIYSLERDDTGTAVDFAPEGYRSEMGYFFRQGNAYVQVIASDPSAPVMDAAETYARKLAADLPEDNTGMQAASALPEKDQVAGSISYIRENAYGQAVLTDVFEAKYKVGGATLTWFAMVAEEERAADAFTQLERFYADYGAVIETGESGGVRHFTGESFGQYSLVYRRSGEVAGVMNAEDLEAARTFFEARLAAAQAKN